MSTDQLIVTVAFMVLVATTFSIRMIKHLERDRSKGNVV